MFNTVKDYASSIQTRVGETYTSYASKDKIDTMLLEVTNNGTWNVSNQKLLELADATQGPESPKIIDHLLLKLKSPPCDWKRIIKSLTAIEFIMKHGGHSAIGKLQMQGSMSMQSLCSFNYTEDGIERGKTIREKTHLLLDLIHNPHKLEIERQAAVEYRNKFYPSSSGYAGSGAGSVGSSSYNNNPTSAGAKTYSPYGNDSQTGSTYNITNNNNINVNYGSNITALSSEGNVPTF